MRTVIAPWFVLAACAAALAQQPDSDLEAAARAVVAAIAPERDDPDAAVATLVDAAIAVGGPVGAVLLREAIVRTDSLQSPASLITRLPVETQPALRRHVAILRLRLQAAAGVTGELRDPWAGDASSLLVVGPFGDHGDHFQHVTFPPELRFPRLGEQLAGRGRSVVPRVLARQPLQPRLVLTDPAEPLTGCWYALHRVRCDAPMTGFAEVECAGAFELFVNGVRLATVDPALAPGSHARQVPMVLQRGENHVLLKTCTTGAHTVAMRYVGTDGAALPGVLEVPAGTEAAPHAAPDPAGAGNWQDGFEQLAAAAGSSPWALAAAAAIAQRQDRTDSLLGLLDQAMQVDVREPQPALVLAAVLRSASDLPEEQRRSRAQQFEELAIGKLPAHHHAALRALITQLEEGDQREQALRLLHKQAEDGHAGPATFSSWHAMVRRLRFGAEELPLLEAWAKTCPGDPRPRGMMANALAAMGNTHGAIEQLRAALAARPDHEPAAQSLFQMALDLQDRALADQALDAWFPANRHPGRAPIALLQGRAALERRTGDALAMRAALDALTASPEADADTHRRIGERLLQLGDAQAAQAAFNRSLALRGDQFELREVAAAVAGTDDPFGHFHRFRRDGLAAARAYAAGTRDSSAPTTALVDQMIVEVLADGSTVQEVHQLRRVNDLGGVEAVKDASAAAAAGELLLLRTIAKDGSTATPVRVDEAFSMTRLEPGAFVEFRFRNFGMSPGPDPWQAVSFLFRSDAEAYVVSELVLVLAPGAPGELRLRGFGAPDEELELDGGRRALVFRRLDVERLPNERATPPSEELVPVVGWGRDGTAAVAARQSRWALLRATRPTPQVARKTAELVAGVEGHAARMLALHAHCQREVSDGSGSGPTETLLRGQGDRFGLFVAMLRAAAVPFRVAAVEDERAELGEGNAALFRPDGSFDVAAVVVTPADAEPTWFFADSPRHYPAGWVPGGRAGARALLCDSDGFELVRVPVVVENWSQAFAARGTASVGARGNVTLDVEVRFEGIAGFGIADALREQTAEDQKQICRQIGQQLLPGWQLSLAEAMDLEPAGRPVVLRFRASRRSLQQAADGKVLLQLPLPRGNHVPSFGDRSERTLPMRLPAELHTRWEVDLAVGAGFELAAVPTPVVVSEGALDYGLVVRPLAGGLRIERTFSVRPSTILPARFGDWMRALAAADRADEAVVELRTKQ